MSGSALHGEKRRQLVRALLPARAATRFRRKCARAATLARLEISGCAFVGPVEPRHRALSRRLEALDAEIAS